MPIISRTEVINKCMDILGTKQIADPDEASEGARRAKGAYDQVVREQLEMNPWYFAKTQIGLPANADAPLYRWQKAYTTPADFLRLVEFEDRWAFTMVRYINIDPKPLYEMQGRSILTDRGAPLNITYIRDVTNDPTIWHSQFVAAVAASLAVQLAAPLTQSSEKAQKAATSYNLAMTQARRVNAIQMPPQVLPDNSWMAARIY